MLTRSATWSILVYTRIFCSILLTEFEKYLWDLSSCLTSLQRPGFGYSDGNLSCSVYLSFFFFSQISVLPEKLLPRDTDEDLGGGHVDDMTKLTYLNEPGVLYNLKRRYALNEIYVSSSLALPLFDGKTFITWISHLLNPLKLKLKYMQY